MSILIFQMDCLIEVVYIEIAIALNVWFISEVLTGIFYYSEEVFTINVKFPILL